MPSPYSLNPLVLYKKVKYPESITKTTIERVAINLKLLNFSTIFFITLLMD